MSHYECFGVILVDYLQFYINTRTVVAAGGRALGKTYMYTAHEKLYRLGYSSFTQPFQSYVDVFFHFQRLSRTGPLLFFLDFIDSLTIWLLLATWAEDLHDVYGVGTTGVMPNPLNELSYECQTKWQRLCRRLLQDYVNNENNYKLIEFHSNIVYCLVSDCIGLVCYWLGID